MILKDCFGPLIASAQCKPVSVDKKMTDFTEKTHELLSDEEEEVNIDDLWNAETKALEENIENIQDVEKPEVSEK